MSFMSHRSRHRAHNICIGTHGGVFSAAHLRYISETALAMGDGRIHLGARQSFLLKLEEPSQLCQAPYVPGLSIHLANVQPPAPCITSALPWHGLGEGTPWLRESHYQQLIDQLGKHASGPALDVHLSDPVQRWGLRHAAPVNLLASTREHYWRLTLHPKTHAQPWITPYVIHTRAAAEAVAALNAAGVLAGAEMEERLAGLAGGLIQHGWLFDPTPLPSPPQRCEPCDGWLRQADGRLALGILNVDGSFAAEFLLELSLLAQRQALRRIGLTPWHGLIVRDITEEQAGAWRLLLSRHSIALRQTPTSAHFWQLGDETAQFQALRRRLISELDRQLGPAADLSFALTDETPSPTTAIVIRCARPGALWPRFDVCYRAGFAEDAPLQVYARRCRRNRLGAHMVQLIREHLKAPGTHEPQEPAPVAQPATVRMQCAACLTQYDPEWGDARGDIPPGILFAELPAGWRCPVCSAPADLFHPVAAPSQNGVHDERAA